MTKLALALLTAAVLTIPPLSAADARTLRLNESLGPGSVEETALLRFKEIVEERTNGDLTIRIFLQDQLGGPQESLEALQTGSLDLYSGDLSYYSKLAPAELDVLALLYLFSDQEHLRRYLTSDVFERAHEKLQAQGIRFISTEFNGDRGPYRVFVSSRPVLSVDDLQGLKMRLWPNDMVIRSWSHLGAVPSVLPWTETYLAIRQNTVQAVTAPLALVKPQGFAEVAPYITVMRQFPQVWPIAVSEHTWRTLTSDQQQILVEAANEATRLYAEITHARAEADVDEMIAGNNAVFIRINTTPFREKMEALYRELISEGALDSDVYDAVNALR